MVMGANCGSCVPTRIFFSFGVTIFKKKKHLFTSSVTIMLGLERNTVYVNEIR